MKKNPASQSGLLSLRVFAALALCSVGAMLGTFSFASNSLSGSVTAASSTGSTSTATVNTTAPPGTPRFFNYTSPQGVADSSGEPSIGGNWTKETVCHNTNVNCSTNN